jgi:uncharacterized integral membrane protein (TIGR00697 family)|nr:MAG TPA: Putative vitamin uptake transporter [Caudoviricetes sp.]
MMFAKATEGSKITPMFCVLAISYAGVLLISNIITSKLIMVCGIVLPAAVILFPLVYIMSDVMTEIYGIRLSMVAIKTNAFLNLFMSLIFMLAISIPAPEFWKGQQAFATVLGNTPRMVVASLIGYFLGDMANSMSLSIMKVRTKNTIFEWFFFRAIGSSLIGQIFDTFAFIFIAFYGVMPTSALFIMAVSQYIAKISYEIVCYPLVSAVVRWWKKVEGIDVYDNQYQKKAVFR